MAKIVLKFPGVKKDILEGKLKEAVEKFGLSAKYFDNEVHIMGPKRSIIAIRQAYTQQKMVHNMFASMGA